MRIYIEGFFVRLALSPSKARDDRSVDRFEVATLDCNLEAWKRRNVKKTHFPQIILVIGGTHGTRSGNLQHLVFESRGALISVSDLPMEKYMHRFPPQPQRQQKELGDCRRRKPFVEDDWRRSTPFKKMRLIQDTQHVINNNENSKSTFYQVHGCARTSRSPLPGFDPLAVTSNAHKMPPPSSAHSRSKAVNWRLACFLAREYLCHGTLLGKPWPLQDSNLRPQGIGTAQSKKELHTDKAASEREAQYFTFTTNFLRSDDTHIPGICNPSQMVAWLGFK
ncbi:hypothetical protein SUGI_0731330 [Cryptomeria japonica]|nr:hypothetical protein SUGI_0731330 [Cryptomeria japonica]